MTEADMIQWAIEENCAAAAIVDTGRIVFDPSFRLYCQENICGKYDANYSCPPDCGTPEEMKQRILAYKKALVLQTLWQVTDYADVTAIKEAEKHHNGASLRVMKKLRDAGYDPMMVGASGCALCTPCAKVQGLPCKFPELKHSCMSAHCIFVKKLADACDMEYDCGEGLLAMFGMLCF